MWYHSFRNRWHIIPDKGLINILELVKKISAAVVVTDKQAAIMFPHDDGETDIRTMFYNGNISSDEGRFHEWCLDFFKHNWENSEHYNKGKLIEV
jgi:predicted transcriptional regulator